MNFREELQRIVDNVPGATACTVMGFDGIAIDTYQRGDGELDVPTLMVEYTSSVRQLWSGEAQGGAVGELMFVADNLTTLIRRLTDEYFLAVVLSPKGITGKARYLMRIAATALIAELT